MCMSCKKTNLMGGKKSSSSSGKKATVFAAKKTPFGKSATKITFGKKK